MLNNLIVGFPVLRHAVCSVLTHSNAVSPALCLNRYYSIGTCPGEVRESRASASRTCRPVSFFSPTVTDATLPPFVRSVTGEMEPSDGRLTSNFC